MARTPSARNPVTPIFRFELRGGVIHHLAASLFLCLVARAVPAQAPVRTRDASFAVIKYDNGPGAAALTLYDGVAITTERATRAAYGLLSVFADGRLSMQAALQGSRRSAAVPVAPRFAPLFSAMRGEVLLDAATTIQSGFMPTAQVSGRARMRFEGADQGGYGELAIARAFDGRFWQTVLSAEGFAFVRRGPVEATLTATPMQLGIGDVLGDTEGSVTWTRGRSQLGATAGVRYGEALRGNTAWGSVTATWPVIGELYLTASLGTYPADIVQSLPAGRYAAIGFRLPEGRFPPLRRLPVPPPPPPRTPDLPVNYRLALVIGPALDSTNIREVKAWAPGATVVEVMADFVDWIPVPLIRQPNGEWKGYYRIPPGLHRVNLRLDGRDIDAPLNWPLVQDEFIGMVAQVLVRGR